MSEKRKPAPPRFGVFDIHSDVRVGTFSLDMAHDRFVGSSKAGAPDIRPAIEKALLAFEAAGPTTDVADPVAWLASLFNLELKKMGLAARPIAPDDIVFNARLDPASGRVLGRASAAEGVQPFPPEMLRKLTQVITRATEAFSAQLATKIATARSVGNHAEAARLLDEARLNGGLSPVLGEALADAVAAVDVSALAPQDARQFLLTRATLFHRLSRHDLAGCDARKLLSGWSDFSPTEMHELRNLVAIEHVASGSVEAAATIWSELAYRTPEVGAATRGMALRNLAGLTPPADATVISMLEQSHDAFLEAGERAEAAFSLVQLGHAFEYHGGERSTTVLDKAERLLDRPDLVDEALRAGLHYARARRLESLERKPEALTAAIASIEARRSLVGEEEGLLASLAVAARLARELGDERAEGFEVEASSLQGEITIPRFSLDGFMDRLSHGWRDEDALAVRDLLDELKDPVVEVATRTALIIYDPAFTVAARLAALEILHDKALAAGVHPSLLTPTRIALAGVLADAGQSRRGITWLKRILEDQPLAPSVASLLMERLRAEEGWAEALAVATREVVLKGESVQRLLNLGEFANSAGHHEEAVRAAAAAKRLPIDAAGRKRAAAIIEVALEEGATLSPSVSDAITRVTTGELEEALDRFASKTASDYRMSYWRPAEGAGLHKWVSHPEQYAKSQIRAWLDATFHGRVTILDEIVAGAGRLDLLLQLAGGLSAILELKMCGGGYASGYASEGETQLRHYMIQRGVNVGYLVVFDGRLRDFGRSVLEPIERGPHLGQTINEVFVDVRSRWKEV